ncbi:MAG: hypothetical protein K2M17_03850, partial [Bacilli bacterium]|nr:hypothetical protein [Bacilli bacterium]
ITTEQLATYELAEINSIESVIAANSIEAILNYKQGTAESTKYYFAIEEKNDSLAYVSAGNNLAKLANTSGKPSYIESSEAKYKFENLKPSTTYIIYSYIVDANGMESDVYTTEITTGEYQLPEVKNMGYTSELNSISVNVTAVDGTNKIVNYYYSIGDGEFVSSTEATHTFNDLNDTSTYKIKVKVEDSEGRFSTIYEENVNTETYINPTITTAIATSTYNTITLTASAEKGTNDITKYYFKKSTDTDWIEQTSNSYTFTGLDESTNYTFNIKAKDTKGRESVVYTTTSIATNAYVLPTVTATTSVTSNSITVSATGTNGDGTIIKYMYKRDGESDWTTVDSTSASDSYTFSSLTPGVTYGIYIKVIDSNGRESTEYTISAKTNNADFTNSTTDVSATYDGSTKKITTSVSPTPTTIYYSTSTQLTTSNYSSSGTTTNPTRTSAGETTVYWCAVKSGYNTFCSSNTITISKATPTFTVSAATAPIGSSATTSSVTYTYIGDGTVSCSPTSGTYASCNVNTSTKTITFTRIAVGTETFTISASAGTNYLAGTSKTVSVAVDSQLTLAEKIKSLYTEDGINNLYKHDGSGSYTNASLESGGGEYRFSGPSSSTNNYVCFGSKATTCPNDYLYRIIGVFEDRVKLIKSDYATSTLLGKDGDYSKTIAFGPRYKGSQVMVDRYHWNKESGTGNWSDSQLNKTNLNTNFINNIGSEWANLIDTTTWEVGGTTNLLSINVDNAAKQAYSYEVKSNPSSKKYSAKIGLLYISDYYYAASPKHWSRRGDAISQSIDYRAAVDDNWMYMGESEWSISPESYHKSALYVQEAGHISSNGAAVDSSYMTVRPSFYLNSNVITTGGTGTSDSPYRIL